MVVSCHTYGLLNIALRAFAAKATRQTPRPHTCQAKMCRPPSDTGARRCQACYPCSVAESHPGTATPHQAVEHQHCCRCSFCPSAAVRCWAMHGLETSDQGVPQGSRWTYVFASATRASSSKGGASSKHDIKSKCMNTNGQAALHAGGPKLVSCMQVHQSHPAAS